jgi:N-formylglutamate deformylase
VTVVRRGNAPLVLGMPHTGTEIPDELLPNSLRLAWLARQGRRLVDRPALCLRRVARRDDRPHRISRSVIDVNRDPSGASLYPGQATTELCPTTTFDGEPLYRDAPPDAAEIGGAATLVRSLSRRARRRARPAARAHHGASSSTTAIRSAAMSRACSMASCRSSTSAPTTARPAIPRSATRWSSDLRRDRPQHVVNGRFRAAGRPAITAAPDGVHAIQMELAMPRLSRRPDAPTTNWPTPRSIRPRPHRRPARDPDGMPRLRPKLEGPA